MTVDSRYNVDEMSKCFIVYTEDSYKRPNTFVSNCNFIHSLKLPKFKYIWQVFKLQNFQGTKSWARKYYPPFVRLISFPRKIAGNPIAQLRHPPAIE